MSPRVPALWDAAALEAICFGYHGARGRFAYRAFGWLNPVVFDEKLPLPLLQWALTPYGGCLGFTEPRVEDDRVITLHPAIWRAAGSTRGGWAARIAPGPRYTLDVILHELIHVEVESLLGGWRGRPLGRSSHNNPWWCEAIERAADRLRGTLLELPAFVARPTVMEHQEDGRRLRRTPAGCLSMKDISRWPHSLRASCYYETRAVPFEWGGT